MQSKTCLGVLGAADHVLGREQRQLASGDGNSRLDRLSRSERPARAAAALVLDRAHHVLGAPYSKRLAHSVNERAS